MTITGDTAVAVSYLQIVTPNRGAPPVEVAGHGTTSGFRIHRAGANRWDLKRTAQGWKVVKRSLRPLDGSREAQDLLKSALWPSPAHPRVSGELGPQISDVPAPGILRLRGDERGCGARRAANHSSIM